MATKNSPEMAPGPIIDFCYPEIMVEKAKKEVCGGKDLFNVRQNIQIHRLKFARVVIYGKNGVGWISQGIKLAGGSIATTFGDRVLNIQTSAPFERPKKGKKADWWPFWTDKSDFTSISSGKRAQILDK